MLIVGMMSTVIILFVILLNVVAPFKGLVTADFFDRKKVSFFLLFVINQTMNWK
jgi:hypothetical protein